MWIGVEWWVFKASRIFDDLRLGPQYMHMGPILGLCSQGHSFVSLRITKVCFTAPNWLKVQEKACALAYRITRSIVVETFRFTYVHTHFLLFRIRLPSFPSPYQIPNLVAELPSSRFRSLSGLLLLSLTSSIGLRALLSLSTCACQLFA